MIRSSGDSDRDTFMLLWAEFLRDANKAGADMLPTPRNLQTFLGVHDMYVSGELEGVVLLAIAEDGKVVGITMSGESEKEQTFDSEFGRVAVGWGTYVVEEHRGEGWSRELRVEMMRLCKDLGFDVVVGPIAKTNEASMESCKKLGIEIPSVVAVRRLEG